MNTKKWTCKNGVKIRIKDMGDKHLANTVAFLERCYQQRLDVSPPCFSGEMAQYYADMEYNDLMSSSIEDLYPIYDDMVKELTKRAASYSAENNP